MYFMFLVFFFQSEDGIRYGHVTVVQTCALTICKRSFWVSAWLAADGVVVTFFVVGCLLVLALGVFSGAVLWVFDDGVGLALLAVFLLAAFFAADFLLGVGKSSGRLKIAPIRVGNLGKGMLI